MEKKRIIFGVSLLLCIVLLTTYIASKEDISSFIESKVIITEQSNYVLKVTEATDSNIVYEIKNNTEDNLYFGVDYKLEKQIDGKWMTYKLIVDFIDMKITCLPKNTYSDSIDLSKTYGPLLKGKYRLIKNIKGQDISAEFNIK